MAVVSNDTGLTFHDLQSTLDPTGEKVMPAVEVLNQINAPLQDGPITKSNAMLGHRVEVRASLPTTSIGQINKGVARSKATVEQRNESMAPFVNRASVDARMKKRIGDANFADLRAGQDRATIESMSQKVASSFCYGSGATDTGFDGLATRQNALAAPNPGQNGSQVWSMGSVVGGDGTSMFIVDWNADTGVHWIYPSHSATGGLDIEDKGENVPTLDNDGQNYYFAAVTEYEWSIGLAVEDSRRIARLANIDTSDASLGGFATQGLIANTLVQMLALMPDDEGFNRVIYCHAKILAAWELQIMNKPMPLYLTMDEYLGKKIPHFHGYPIRRLDQIILSEGPVS